MNEWLDRWEAAEAQWVVDEAITVDLPQVAVEAMVDGWDSQSLRLLAGTPQGDGRDARDLFLAAVSELGRELPSVPVATRRLLRFLAAHIVAGSSDPVTGARAIARLGYGRRGQDFPMDVQTVVATFDGLDDEWVGGWGRSRADVEATIRNEARELTSWGSAGHADVT